MSTLQSLYQSTKKATKLAFIAMCVLIATACTNVPDGIEPVENFQLESYLGTWYEIARLDHRFEKNLDQVSATYTPRNDGGITVFNQGVNTVTGESETIEGRAYFAGSEDEGFLKVSFFGPFFASYIVFETDYENYAYVSGPNRDYLWLLHRDKNPAQSVIETFVSRAQSLGYDTSKLIFVSQNITN